MSAGLRVSIKKLRNGARLTWRWKSGYMAGYFLCKEPNSNTAHLELVFTKRGTLPATAGIISSGSNGTGSKKE